MPDAATGTLRDRYQAELAARGFRSDPAQLRAIDRLDKLRRALLRADRSDRAPARVLPISIILPTANVPQRAVTGASMVTVI